jgi:hypothetical protein
MKNVRFQAAQARLQGMNARKPAARTVPTALALSEFSRSPRTSRAKLVVMPQDGHGSLVIW